MRIVLLGPPGAGKGTQACILAEKLDIPHISTGDIFRSNIKKGTELGKKAKEFIDKGLLVPDEITINIIKDRLLQDDCKKGFILDGFPRTIAQAEYLEEALKNLGMPLDYAVSIEVPDERIIKRLSGRRVCPKCGATYHIIYCAPKKDGICDKCNEGIIQRDDDKEETIIIRLKTYHRQTEPLLDFYKKAGKLIKVESTESIDKTHRNMLNALGV
ncbi:MAG: adenylate kinase [Acetivibrionales bacterium]